MRGTMKMMIVALAAGAFGALSMPAIAQQTSGSGAGTSTETPEATDDSQKIRCERQAVTGSRARKKRVCLTEAQWKARGEAGQRSADSLITDANRNFPEVN